MNLRSTHANRQGVALVLVLAFISLLSALLIAFFSSTSNSRREASQYEAGVTTAQLSETAQNLVIGQISDATKTFDTEGYNASAAGMRLTYASQPGMIRTYGTDNKYHRIYKLYSSGKMVLNDTEPSEWSVSSQLATEVPLNWVQNPAGYTDLNEPVLVPDPQGLIVPTGTNQRYTANYPILDPAGLSPTGSSVNSPGGLNQDGIDGFDISNPPGYGGPGAGARPVINPTYNPITIPASGKTGNPVPMPVQWIYVLQNGTLTSPNTVNGTVASWSNLQDTSPNKPTKTNPIVGRVAFWTDDDTCKLNPNVNSEGTAWDTPLNGSDGSAPYGEAYLRDNQPIVYEFQRYPGHPAMTSLSPIFGFLPQYRIPGSDGTQDTSVLARYYSLIPRVVAGGSNGGTTNTTTKANVSIITTDMDRMYASVDELMFRPVPRIPNDSAFLNRSVFEKTKFFLTTSAKTPEVTMFGTPRIGLWSVQQQADPNNGAAGAPLRPRSGTDEMIAFCNTLGLDPKGQNTNTYYFQRQSIYLRDPINNRLAHPTTISGQTAPAYVMPSSQSTTADWTFKPTQPNGYTASRNQDLYHYLQQLTAMPIPGFGGKLTDLYPSGPNNNGGVRDQILTEMFDMTRLTNCYSLNQSVSDGSPRFEFAPARQMPDAVSGETQIVPVVPPDGGLGAGTKGFGRFPTVTEGMLIFYRSLPTPASNGNPAHENMRIVLALEPYTPEAGSWTWSPLVRYVVRGLDNMTIQGAGLSVVPGAKLFAPESINFVTARCGYASGSAHNQAHCGTFANFRRWMGASRDTTKLIPTDAQVKAAIAGTRLDDENYYPFVSVEIPVDVNNFKGFTMGSFDITIEVHSGYTPNVTPTNTQCNPQTLVQTIQMHFPGVTLPAPTASPILDFYQRMSPEPGNSGAFNPIQPQDVVRSVEVSPTGPSLGDLRMISAQKNVLAGYYDANPAYATAITQEHSFRNGDGGAINALNSTTTETGSTLVTGLAKNNYVAARGMNGAFMKGGQLGDWDNGPKGFMDGAYINKPDDHYGTQGGGDTYDAVTTTPNRQVSSAVMFGSLPTGEPWRTLCFTAAPAAGPAHPSLAKSFLANVGTRVRDHMFLDFFTMPVVEPYAISEPMASMGKVNLNYQIAPFSYITRNTALQGVLKTTRIFAASAHGNGSRLQIDVAETLKGFAQRFDDSKRGIFRSATEICDMYLVPKGSNLTAVPSWWNGFKATGDNGREAPYGQIYSRVCTKSNTFTIHMRVQTLRKRPPTDPKDTTSWGQWDETKDNVTGEYRGSSTVERYVDIGGNKFPDFAKDFGPTATSATSLDRFYKFRIVQTKRFNP